MKVINHWNGLPRDMADALSFGVFKIMIEHLCKSKALAQMKMMGWSQESPVWQLMDGTKAVFS